MFGSVQRGHTFNDDPARSRAFDLRAHFVQERCQVDHFRLLGRSFNNGHSIGQHGSHHHVICPEDSGTEFTLHVDHGSVQFRSKNLDVAALMRALLHRALRNL